MTCSSKKCCVFREVLQPFCNSSVKLYKPVRNRFVKTILVIFQNQCKMHDTSEQFSTLRRNRTYLSKYKNNEDNAPKDNKTMHPICSVSFVKKYYCGNVFICIPAPGDSISVFHLLKQTTKKKPRQPKHAKKHTQ